jgi:hypothetical protein
LKHDPAGRINGASDGSGGSSSDTSVPLAGDAETTLAGIAPEAGVVGETTTASSGAVKNSSICDITCPNVTCEANVIT